MTDPLSVTAGVAGLVTITLQGVRLLVNDINNIREAPKSLEALQVDLTSIGSSLECLENIDELQLRLLGDHVYDHWTKRSHDGKLSWWDKTNIGIFKEQQIEVMSRQLQNCKLTLNLVAVTATLMSTAEEIKRMLATGQAETVTMIASVDRQIGAAENSLDQIHQFEASQASQQDDEDKENARRAIEEEVAMPRESQEIMRSILASMQAKLAECAAGRVSNVSTSVSFGAKNHGFQVETASGAISGISFGKN
ncbi:hypothetical protein MBLNU13_g00765t2 [Cladosporium sp. NU13]